MQKLFHDKEEELEEEKKELLRWFSPQEVLWLQEEHPHLAHIAADPASGSQVIFEVREIIDEEFYLD